MEERVVAQRVELVAAEIVCPPLHVADLERTEKGFEEGDVFEEELLLQIFGAGGDDDALLALASEPQSGQEVGEGLAGAGAGFDDEVTFFLECGFDGSGHFVLAAAVFEGEGGLGEDAPGGEEIVKRGQPVRNGLSSGGDRDGGRGGHRDRLAYDSCTPPPPPAKVCKVFEVDTLGLDLESKVLRIILDSAIQRGGWAGILSSRWLLVCKVGAPEPDLAGEIHDGEGDDVKLEMGQRILVSVGVPEVFIPCVPDINGRANKVQSFG